MTEKITYVCDICGKEYAPHQDAKSQCLAHEKMCVQSKVEHLVKKYKPRIVLYVVTWCESDPDKFPKIIKTKLFLYYRAAANFRDKCPFTFSKPEINTLELDYSEE